MRPHKLAPIHLLVDDKDIIPKKVSVKGMTWSPAEGGKECFVSGTRSTLTQA